MTTPDGTRPAAPDPSEGVVTVSRLGRRHGHHAPLGVRLTTMAVVAVLSAGVLAGSGWAWYRYRQFNQDVVRVNVLDPQSGPSAAKDIDGKAQNILLVGNDDRSDATPAELQQLGTQSDGGSINADTTLLIHIPADGKNAVGISFPRDSYVQIADGYGTHKLNSAYPDGYYSNPTATTAQKQAAGGRVLIQTIQNLTGLHIDGYVSVDLLGFYRISQAIGGINVNICQATQDSNSGANFHAGINTLDGSSALAFVRQRDGLVGGDLDRIKRQQYFLAAAFRKITSAGVLLSPSKLSNLLDAVDKSIQIDGLDLVGVANQISGLSANNINFQTIPTQGDITTDDGDSLQVDPGQVQAFVQKLIGQSNGAAVTPASVSLAVRNASGTGGLAATTAATLTRAGFTVTGTADVAGQATTTVEYPSGSQPQAAVLAQYVPGARTEQTADVSAVTLVLGSDGKRAIAALPTASASPSTPSAPVTTKPADSGCIN